MIILPHHVLALVRELGIEGAERALEAMAPGCTKPRFPAPAAPPDGVCRGVWRDGSADAQLRELRLAGWTTAAIAERMGLTERQVGNRIAQRHRDLITARPGPRRKGAASNS